MVKVAYGDEPYRIDILRNDLKESVGDGGFNLTSLSGSFDGTVYGQCVSIPFLGGKRAVILDCDNIKCLDTEEFKTYVEKPSDSCNLLVILRDVDRRSRLFRLLQKKELLVECSRYKSTDEIIRVLGKELKNMGASMNKDALSEFLARQDYLHVDSISMLDMVGYLKSLAAINSCIDRKMVERIVPRVEEPNCFRLASLIKSKDITTMRREIELTDSADCLKVMGLLAKEFRVSYKQKLFDSSTIGVTKTALFTDISLNKLSECLEILNDGALDVKEGRFDPSHALLNSCIHLSAVL